MKIASQHCGIRERVGDRVARAGWQLRVGVQEEQDLAARRQRPRVELRAATAGRLDDASTGGARGDDGAVGAPAVGDDDLIGDRTRGRHGATDPCHLAPRRDDDADR